MVFGSLLAISNPFYFAQGGLTHDHIHQRAVNSETSVPPCGGYKYPDLEEAQFDAAIFKIALASLEAEPVAYIFKHPAGRLFWALSDEEQQRQSDVIPVYAAPPAPVAMKDHQIRELVNELRDIAVEYHGTQQLRERIARTVRAAMLQSEPVNQPSSNHPSADAVVGCEIKQPSTNEHVTQIKQVADCTKLLCLADAQQRSRRMRQKQKTVLVWVGKFRNM
jgi:hypothetical protein